MISQPSSLPTTDTPQEGFVLIVGLVILGLLTMLALSGMRDTTMQEKMAGASRDSGLAFQAAESALRDAENCMANAAAACAFDAAANDAHFTQEDATFPEHNTLFNATTWDAYDPPGEPTPLAGVPSIAKGDAADGVNYIVRLAATPESAATVISMYGEKKAAEAKKIYEITARGAGTSGAGQSVLRVYYKK
jgi:Tfp pilus assembly protein PilX